MPTLLDLYCGAGGASVGYRRAGFDKIYGVDNKPQPHYPFDGVMMDAIEALKAPSIKKVDLIHASPPCQFYSIASFMFDRGYPDLIEVTREALIETGRPYVIENVPGAPLKKPILVCGSGLGMLRIRRHRLFEANFFLESTECNHDALVEPLSVHGHSESGKQYWERTMRHDFKARCDAMGISWMNRSELAESVPPAYTEFIGRQFLQGVERGYQ